jgi:hypothetical protein
MSTLAQTYVCTPRQARKFIIEVIQAGLVPFVKSSPGVGKSSLLRAICKEFNLFLIDHRASTSVPEDFSGLPKFTDDNLATFRPFDLFPIETTPIPAGYDGFFVFLDEFNHAVKQVQAASYKLLLDKMVGQFSLHPSTAVALAGNLMTDKAFVNPLSTALQSRVVHILLVPDVQEWLADVAIPNNYDERIIAFILDRGLDVLMDFDPNHNNETFCCPRTWEFMNKLIDGKTYSLHNGVYTMDEMTPLYAGTITPGVAVDFVQYTKVFSTLIPTSEIVNDPNGAECLKTPGQSGPWLAVLPVTRMTPTSRSW